MKKRFLVAAALVAMMPCAFAERYFEIGVDAPVSVSQNLMSPSEIFVEELVFDFNKIYEGMTSKGFVVNASARPEFYMNLNVPAFSAGLHWKFDANVSAGISKDFFKFLAEGNKIGEPISTDINAGADAFLSIEAPAKFKVNAFTVKLKCAYFVPILYLPNPKATAVVNMGADGSIKMDANADFALYSIVPLDGIFEGNFNSEAMLGSLSSDILNSGGFDVDCEVLYEVMEEALDVGGYIHVPVVPGHLRYVTTGGVGFSMTESPVMASMIQNGGSPASPEIEGPTFTDIAYGSADYVVNRPLKVGVSAEFRPFGDWFLLNGKLGYSTRNPFSADYSFVDNSTVEYSVGLELVGVKVFKLWLATDYLEKVFSQTVGFGIDLRVLELDTIVSVSSPDFVKSFTASGLTATVSLKVGF